MSAPLDRDDPKVLVFVEAACRGIRSRRLRREIREELLSHIEAAFAGKLDGGLEPAQALAQALEDLGAPAELARGFRVAHRPVYLQWRV
jgi:hypothetical protein